MCLLTVYEVPMTSVEGLKLNKCLQRWVGGSSKLHFSRALHKIGTDPNAFVICDGVIQVGKVQSRNEVQRLKGCKWVADSVTQAESMLKLHGITGMPCTGRRGLGTSHFQK